MTYTAIVTREGDNWLADVEGVDGAHTFGRSLEALAKSIQEVIVLMDDLADDSVVEVDYVYDVADEAVLAAALVGRARAELAAKDVELQKAALASVTALKVNGFSVRDAAHLLGMTPGRVSQLANSGGGEVKVSKGTTVKVTNGSFSKEASVTKRSRAAAAGQYVSGPKRSSRAAKAKS